MNSIDASQYGNNVLSLAETKKQNDIYIYNYESYNDVYNNLVQENEPENNGYFRTFLYDLNMEYSMPVNDTEIRPYQIVSEFDIFLDYMHKNNPINEYENKVKNLLNKNKFHVPYT